MGRTLRGTLHNKNGTWTVAVPRARGDKRRIQASFDDQAIAERWRDDAIAALLAGRPVPTPDRYRAGRVVVGRTGDAPEAVQPRFREVCAEWVEETYVLDRAAGGDRRERVIAIVERHIVPFFEQHVEYIADLKRDHVDSFKRHLAGRGTTPRPGKVAWPDGTNATTMLTVRRAARLVGKSVVTIRTAFHAGKFPGAIESARPGDPTHTVIHIPAGDLVSAGFTFDGSVQPVAYSTKYASDIAWALRRITEFACAKGYITTDPARDLRVVPPTKKHMRRKPNVEEERPLELAECKQAFSHLHIHHQLAGWLGRLLGLRISEAFGLHLSDITEQNGVMVVSVRRQGGKSFLAEDPNSGEEVRVSTKSMTKTAAGRRDLVVTEPLAELIRSYIKAFHGEVGTGQTGEDSRLIVPLRADSKAGQGSYRTALKRALQEEGLDFASVGFHASSHFLRKSLSTDLAFGNAFNEVVRSLYMGHRPKAHDGGADVTMNRYTLRPNMFAEYRKVAEFMAAKVATDIGQLIAPTSLVALSSPSLRLDDDRKDWVRSVFTDAGYIADVDDLGQLCSISEARQVFHVSRTVISGWIRRGLLDTVKTTDRHGKVCRLIPMASINRRLEDLGLEFAEATAPGQPGSVTAIADAAGVPADTVARAVRRLGVEFHTDPTTLAPLLSDGDVELVNAEIARLARIDERSMRIRDAGQALGLTYSGAKWLHSQGHLEDDPETTPDDGVFVLRASVEREIGRRASKRRPRRRPTTGLDLAEYVSITEVMTRTGLGYSEALALRKHGVSWRRDSNLRYFAERTSFETYIHALEVPWDQPT